MVLHSEPLLHLEVLRLGRLLRAGDETWPHLELVHLNALGNH